MKDELTEKMHAEFSIDEETEILHRCITIWCNAGADPDKPDFEKLCNSYGVTTNQAMKHKDYCLSFKSDNNEKLQKSEK